MNCFKGHGSKEDSALLTVNTAIEIFIHRTKKRPPISSGKLMKGI